MSDCKALTLMEAPPRRYEWGTDQEVIDALYAHEFHIGATARFFGIKRRELAARIAETPELQLEQTDFIEEAVDDAEGHFIRGARIGRADAVMGLLNSRGKARGYGKQDNVSEAIEVIVRQIAKE